MFMDGWMDGWMTNKSSTGRWMDERRTNGMVKRIEFDLICASAITSKIAYITYHGRQALPIMQLYHECHIP